MPNNHSTLTSLFKDIADAIRRKTGGTEKIVADAFPSAIRAIETGGGGGTGAAGDYRAMTGMIEGTLSGAYTNYSVRTITPYALRFCQQAETLAFPEAITIATGAFYDLNGLKSVNLPKVRELDYQCFRSCNNLENVNINACLSLNSEVFMNCAKLKSINIDSLEYVGSSAFQYCKSLQTLNAPNLFGIWKYGFYSCGFSHISMPKLEYIGSYAFAYCNNLLELSLPNLQAMQQYAFQYCTSLSFVHISTWTGYDPPVMNSLYASNICYYNFANCNNLKEAHFPDALVFSTEFFRNCTKLEYVNAPKIQKIDDSFGYCYVLKEANFPDCSYVGAETFYQNYALSRVNMPKCVTLGQYCFYQCSSLTSLSFPMLQNITGQNVFNECIKLSALYLLSTSVCTLQYSVVFTKTPITDLSYLGYYGSIYVPGDLVSVYQSAQNWSFYSSRITAYLGS